MNVASRLESSGISGRIQITEQVAEILSKHVQFETECRGPIEVKGKGLLTTYLVITPYDNIEIDGEMPASGESVILGDAGDDVGSFVLEQEQTS